MPFTPIGYGYHSVVEWLYDDSTEPDNPIIDFYCVCVRVQWRDVIVTLPLKYEGELWEKSTRSDVIYIEDYLAGCLRDFADTLEEGEVGEYTLINK